MKKRILIGLFLSMGAVLSAEGPVGGLGATGKSIIDKNEKVEPGTIYSPIGKRDPFKPPSPDALGRDVAALNPLERYSIEQLQLRAILRGLGKPRAMIEDPEGGTFILVPGEVVGREHATVSRVLNKGIVLTERTFNYLGQESLYEKVLSLNQDADAAPTVRTPQSAAGGPAGAPETAANWVPPAANSANAVNSAPGAVPGAPPSAAPAPAPAAPTNAPPAAEGAPAAGSASSLISNPFQNSGPPGAMAAPAINAAPIESAPAAAAPPTITNKPNGLVY